MRRAREFWQAQPGNRLRKATNLIWVRAYITEIHKSLKSDLHLDPSSKDSVLIIVKSTSLTVFVIIICFSYKR